MFQKIDLVHPSLFLCLTIFQLGCKTTDEKTQSIQDTSSTNEEPHTNEPSLDFESTLACVPKPNDQMSKLAVDVFQKFMNVETQGCYLDRIYIESEGEIEEIQTFEHPTELLCDDENNCEQKLGHFAWAWSQSPEYDYESLRRYDDMYEGVIEGRRTITGGVETIEIILNTNISGSTADRRVERIYNSSGNLLSETYYFADSRWFEVFNVWENGHLVEQDFFDYINFSGHSATLKWTYDNDGRLTSSSFINQNNNLSTREHHATFSYNSDGQLIEAQRRIDNEIWLVQNWEYETGVLLSRSNTFSSNYSWISSADSFINQTPYDYMSHWDHSLKIVSDDCVQPPRSLFHGYPDEEVIYRLGWSRNDVPRRVGFAYNYDGYGWMYGDLSWFGHNGIASFYDIDYGDTESEITTTMLYDEEVMVEETVHFFRNWNGESEQVTIHRNREIEHGNIVTDTLTTTVDTNQSQETSASLSFSYDSSGAITQRDLYHDELLIHMSHWNYNDQGYMIEHGVSGRSYSTEDGINNDFLDTELITISTYRQNITDSENEFIRIRELNNGDTNEWLFVDQLRTGIHDRGSFEEFDGSFVVYDSEERIVITGQGDSTAPEYFQEWTMDEHDLLQTWKVVADDNVTRSYTHICDIEIEE